MHGIDLFVMQTMPLLPPPQARKGGLSSSRAFPPGDLLHLLRREGTRREREAQRECVCVCGAMLEDTRLVGISPAGVLRLQGKLVEKLRTFSSADSEILGKFIVSVLEDVQARVADRDTVKSSLRSALLDFNSNEEALSDFIEELLSDLESENWLLLTDPARCKEEKSREWEREDTEERGKERRKFRFDSPDLDRDDDQDTRSTPKGTRDYRRRRSRSRSPPAYQSRRDGDRRDSRGRDYRDRDRDRGKRGDRGFSRDRGGRGGRGGRGDRGGFRGGDRDRGGPLAKTTLHVSGLPHQDHNMERKIRSHFYRFGHVSPPHSLPSSLSFSHELTRFAFALFDFLLSFLAGP